jgi:putative integral membrane protein (TIGR02587 family)
MVETGLEKSWTSEADDAVRGLSGGFLIGVPVVFAVDSWWLGDQLTPANALYLIAFAYLLTLAVVFWSGFRTGARATWRRLGDALEAMALAIFTLFVVFGSLGQIFNGQPITSTVGRIAVALAPLSIGIAVANHVVPRGASRVGNDVERRDDVAVENAGSDWQLTAHELGAAAAGALFICMAIVPGDELTDIVTEVPLRNLPFVIVLSLLFSYVVVFAAGFRGQRQRRIDRGPLQHPVAETVSAYVVALAISWFALGFFGHVGFHTPGLVVFMKCVLLAFPASVGAAAGRLAV